MSDGNLTAPPVLPEPEILSPTNDALRKRVQIGAGWLYWIAGLSAVNIVLSLTESPIRFAIGLGITELLQGIGQAVGSIGGLVGTGFSLVILGLIAALGYAGQKLQGWAIVTGIVVMALDTVLLGWLLAGEAIIGLVFHGIALFGLWGGYGALRMINQRKRDGKFA